MNVCRRVWMGFVSLLLPLFSAGAASAASGAPVPDIPENGVLRHFHYWAEYGEMAKRPGGLERVRFELGTRHVYFSQGRPCPDSFKCQTNGTLNREIVPVLTSLDFSDWPGQMEAPKLYDLTDREKARLCRWHLSAVFEPDKPEAQPISFTLTGADDGSSPKRLAAEQAFLRFFGPKLDVLKSATPRRLTHLYWMEHGTSYTFDAEDGIATLERRKEGSRIRKALYPGFTDELNDLIRSSDLEKSHGFLKHSDDWPQKCSLNIRFDTSQRIEVIGHHGSGGMPEGFREALAPLLKAMDEALEPSTISKALPPTILKGLEFRVAGMVIGEKISLYERMDKDGPALVLNRTVGHSSDNRKEAVLDAAQAAELEALLTKNNVTAWNGFNGRPLMDVLDGENFTLSVIFRDGAEIAASGENKFPAGYRTFRIDLNSFADRVLGAQERP